MISAALALILFVLHVNNREPALLDLIADPMLFALIGFLGGALMFRSVAAGGRFAAAFLLYPLVARAFYQMGRALPYGGAMMDLLTNFYFTLVLPAMACGVIGAMAVGLLLPSQRFIRRGFGAFAIAGAIGGAAAPLISWSLSRMAAESASAATLAIYGEGLLRFFLAGFGLGWILRIEATS